MFKKLKSGLAIINSLTQINEGLTVMYTAIVKALTALQFIQKQLNDTKLGNSLKEYLPPIIDVLVKVKSVIEKYGKILGFSPPVNSLTTIDDSNLVEELEESAKRLDEIL